MSDCGFTPTTGKIVTLEQAQARVIAWRQAGKQIAYTNGCFDLVHAGHVRTLEAARQMADVLVVGINSDDSVRRLKGPGRPIMPELSSLPTIQALRPEVWVKGGDYTLETVHQEERAYVESYGGRVALAPRVAGVSTSELLARIKRLLG